MGFLSTNRRLNKSLILFLLIFFVLLSLFQFKATEAASDGVGVGISVSTSGGSSGGSAGPTQGCTNPTALNYNSLAGVDDGSCQYPPTVTVPNVSNFKAILNDEIVNLSWEKPVFTNFSAVRITRKKNSLPSGPTDGQVIYDGESSNAQDQNLDSNTTYYYAAFVRDTGGSYSSGVLTSLTTPTSPPPEENETPPPSTENENTPGTDNQNTGGATGNGLQDPFASLPQVTSSVDPITQKLVLGDFIFYQPGERQQFFRNNQDIRVIGWKPLIVTVSANKLPPALKVIGLTIVDPTNKQAPASYLLKISDDNLNYTASLGHSLSNGTYSLFISIINYRDQTLKRLSGRLLVSDSPVLSPTTRIINQTKKVAIPLAVTAGLASGLAQGLAITERVSSGYDLYLVLVHFWSFILRFLGLRKKSIPWGVVYDSVTKRPLDPAYVVVKKNNDDFKTAITDLDGRYGFLLPDGNYNLVANKTHYQFPSKKLAGRERDELYGNLYFGENFQATEGETINRNIPLDPVAFDWNEFAKKAQGFFILHSRREIRKKKIFNAFYAIGFTLGLYNLIFYPSKLAIVVFILYLITFFAKYFQRKSRNRARVVKRENGQPIPFAIIRAFVPDVDQEVKSVVADAFGRFFLLTPPGKYYITVDEKLPDESYKRIHQTPVLDLKDGILTNDLNISL